MAAKNIIQQLLGLNFNEDELKYRQAMMENVKSTADFGQARPQPHGVAQYPAQDVSPVNVGSMPSPFLTQGQPQYANLMNIKNRLAPLYFRR